jgi:hypothetical protein
MNVTKYLPRLGQLLAVALILTGSHAYGQSTTALQSVGVTFSGTSGATSADFTGFDTSLGTLTSVTVNLTGVEVNGYATLTANTTGQSINSAFLSSAFQLLDLTSTAQVTVTVTTANAASPFGTTVANGSTYFVGGTAGGGQVGNGYIQTAGGGGTTPPGNFVPASSAPPTTGTPSTFSTDLAAYEGASTTVDLTVNGVNQLSSTTSGGFNTAVNDTTTGTVTLFYTYTPVPEPSKTTACMIGFALCLLVGRNYFKGRSLGLA